MYEISSSPLGYQKLSSGFIGLSFILYTPFDSTDINECSSGGNDCHDDATCTNLVGSYKCTCNSGFRGAGSYCTGESYKKIIHFITVRYFNPYTTATNNIGQKYYGPEYRYQ